MQNSEWTALIARVPRELHDGLVIQTSDGTPINIQYILRSEEHFAVIRGRLGGSTDTGYTFFMPYDQIVCLYHTKGLKDSEINAWFGPAPQAAIVESVPEAAATTEPAVEPAPQPAVTAAPAAPIPAEPPLTTATITTKSGAIPLPGKAAILERLRKRTGASAPGTIPKPPLAPPEK